ncbi:MAG: pseudouridine synthase, partial [Saprospiraceae bacterium]
LNELFVKKEINKKYNAISIGEIKNKQGEINSKIDDKESRSSYEVKKSIPSEKYDSLNLLELIPHTGRRHQLRKHLHEIGHPILGDKDYFLEGKISYGNGLYLHASYLEFTHPFTKENLKVGSSLPKKFRKIFP